MTVHLDTSVLVEAFVPSSQVADRLRRLAGAGDRPALSSLVLFEWLRGPRTAQELELHLALFPDDRVVACGAVEAARASTLYRALSRPRGREADIVIAACAIEHDAALWTLNTDDFQGIPGLRLYKAV